MTGSQGRRAKFLLSTSAAALLIGAGIPSAFAACFTGPFPTLNTGTLACITVANTSFSGPINNIGTISPSGISITNSTITGTILNAGTIAGGLTMSNSTIVGEILSPGVFAGGINIHNTGQIQSAGSGSAIEINGATLTGGITNARTISASIFSGVAVGGLATLQSITVSTFTGGITNSGAIRARLPVFWSA